MLYKFSNILVYVYIYTDRHILTGNNFFSGEAYCIQVTRLPPFFYVWPSHEAVKQNQFTKSAKRKKLKRRQPSETRNAVLKLLKQHQL